MQPEARVSWLGFDGAWERGARPQDESVDTLRARKVENGKMRGRGRGAVQNSTGWTNVHCGRVSRVVSGRKFDMQKGIEH